METVNHIKTWRNRKARRVGQIWIKIFESMKKAFFIIITLALASTSTMFYGCATILAKKNHTVAVNAYQPSVNVYVNGLMMGTTPVELHLKADKSYTIEFRKEGFDTVTRVINTKVGGGWIVLDVLCGIVPLIVDAATGAWKNLDQDEVNAVLVEQNK